MVFTAAHALSRHQYQTHLNLSSFISAVPPFLRGYTQFQAARAALSPSHTEGCYIVNELTVCIGACSLTLMILSIITLRIATHRLVVVTVESTSMSPALNDGDRVLVLKNWPAEKLRRGQIVVVWPWNFTPDRRIPFGVAEPFIKRIVGLPGDTIVTTISELAQRHRERLSESYDAQGERVWHVPPGHCFVRGDLQPGGHDSLTWGPISFNNVLGVVILKLPTRVAHKTGGDA